MFSASPWSRYPSSPNICFLPMCCCYLNSVKETSLWLWSLIMYSRVSPTMPHSLCSSIYILPLTGPLTEFNLASIFPPCFQTPAACLEPFTFPYNPQDTAHHFQYLVIHYFELLRNSLQILRSTTFCTVFLVSMYGASKPLVRNLSLVGRHRVVIYFWTTL